jgi:hypothetical protein
VQLRIADIFQNKFYKHFTDDDIFKDIRSNDIINIYELEKPSQISSLKRSRSDNGRINAPITTDTSLSAEQQQQQQEQQPEILHYPVVFTTPESIQNPGFSLSTTLYGEPQFIAVPSIVSWSELWEKVLCTFS